MSTSAALSNVAHSSAEMAVFVFLSSNVKTSRATCAVNALGHKLVIKSPNDDGGFLQRDQTHLYTNIVVDTGQTIR